MSTSVDPENEWYGAELILWIGMSGGEMGGSGVVAMVIGEE